MPAEFMMRRCWALRWDGTNGAEVAALITSMDTDEATYQVAGEVPGDRLTLRAYDGGVWVGVQIVVTAAAPWVVCDIGAPTYELLSDASKEARYLPGPAAAPLLGVTTPPPAPTYTIRDTVGAAELPVLTLVAPTAEIQVAFTPPMPLSMTASMVRWRALAGARVLTMLSLQQIAEPIVLVKSSTETTGVRIFLRTTGVASLAGVLLVDAQQLVQS